MDDLFMFLRLPNPLPTLLVVATRAPHEQTTQTYQSYIKNPPFQKTYLEIDI